MHKALQVNPAGLCVCMDRTKGEICVKYAAAARSGKLTILTPPNLTHARPLCYNKISAAINTLGAFCGKRDLPALTQDAPPRRRVGAQLQIAYGTATRAANPAFATKA